MPPATLLSPPDRRIAHQRPQVPWRDLSHLSRRDVASELLLSAPWLCASLLSAHAGWYVLALPCSFVFFLTGLRQVHGAYHYSLGLSRRWTEWVIASMSLLMLGSMHAVQINHLRHHAHCMDDDDVEAMSARMPAWKALLTGPLFPIRLHAAAWARGNSRQKRWIVAELGVTSAMVALAWLLELPWFRYHVGAMLTGQCLTSFFAVWTVHHDCDRDVVARTIRGRFKAFVTYEMFYHLEHHLFPAVPTRRLPELSARLDAVAPNLSRHRVF